MDRVDFGILKLLLANNGAPPGATLFRRSFRSMGRELGVDQGTIRSRIRTFQEQGFLRGWYLGVSPGAAKQDVIHAWLLVGQESNKDGVIRKLLSQKGVERVCNYLGPRVGLVLLHENGSDPNLSLGHLAASTGLGGALHKQVAIHVQAPDLKDSDVAIINELREDPWKPYSEIARELKMSSRTVKRRVANLAETSVIYMLPLIDLKAIQGIIPMELVVQYTSGESKAAVNRLIMSRVKENLVFSDVSGHHGYFALAAPNLAYVEHIAEWVGKQEGVRQVHSNAIQDVILNRKFYDRPPRPARLSSEGERVVA